MRKRVYISGAITGTKDYSKRFEEAEKYLKSLGYEVINPAAVCARLPELSHAEYMDICIPMLYCCDTLYLLRGWEHSTGAKIENYIACDKGCEILYEKLF